jgi:hypothetical protein
LKVTDSSGKSIQASLRSEDKGRVIAIEIYDSGAEYPLTIDPTWSASPELNCSAQDNDYCGSAVVISGTTAFVGAPGQSVGSNYQQGEVFEFSLSDGSWYLAQTIKYFEGEAQDDFGSSLAFSGSTLVVGAPGDEDGDGEVFMGHPGFPWVPG